MRNHPLIKVKADNMRPVDRRSVPTEHVLDMAARIGLVPQVIQRVANQSIADGQFSRVSTIRDDAAEPFGKFQCSPILPTIDTGYPEPPERPYLIVPVIQLLC